MDVHGFLGFQFKACGSRVKNFLKQSTEQRKRQFSELLMYLGMWECQRRDVHVSSYNRHYSQHMKTYKRLAIVNS